MKQTQFNCPVEATLSLIGGRDIPNEPVGEILDRVGQIDRVQSG